MANLKECGVSIEHAVIIMQHDAYCPVKKSKSLFLSLSIGSYLES